MRGVLTPLDTQESSWQSRQMRLSEDSVLAVHGEPAMESEPQALVQRSAAKLKLGFGRRTRNKQLPKRQDSRDGTGRALAKRDHLAGGHYPICKLRAGKAWRSFSACIAQDRLRFA